MGEKSVTVRRALPADAAAIARIYNEGIEDRVATFDTDMRTPEEITAILIERGEADPTVVAELDGQIAAWAWVSPYRTRQCYAGIAEFSVYVAREERGRGAGRVALTALLKAAADQGFWKVLSRVFPENQASRSLCRSLGFREVGVYRNHARLDGAWKDVVIVEKLLGDAADEREVHPAE